jgi:hypothetical protein
VLDRLHDTTALKRLIQPHSAQQPFSGFFDKLREQVASEEDDKRTEHRRNDFGELKERNAETFEEGHGGKI